jgi:hypothetical protein
LARQRKDPLRNFSIRQTAGAELIAKSGGFEGILAFVWGHPNRVSRSNIPIVFPQIVMDFCFPAAVFRLISKFSFKVCLPHAFRSSTRFTSMASASMASTKVHILASDTHKVAILRTNSRPCSLPHRTSSCYRANFFKPFLSAI